jgi:hypothetical protein
MLRSSQIAHIWKQVFSADGEAGLNRLHFVIGSQAVNPDVTRQLLACPAFSSIDRKRSSLAIAPYFGTYTPSVDTNLGHFLNTTLPSQIAALSTQVTGHHQFVKANNLSSLITYECGQGLQGSGQVTSNTFIIACLHMSVYVCICMYMYVYQRVCVICMSYVLTITFIWRARRMCVCEFVACVASRSHPISRFKRIATLG